MRRCTNLWAWIYAAAEFGVSHSEVSKGETANLVPDVESVVPYLQACSVTVEAREWILQLVHGTTDAKLLASGLPDSSSQLLAGVLECERIATEIDQWAPLLVPGLLQTPDDARAILDSGERLSPKELDALVNARRSAATPCSPNRFATCSNSPSCPPSRSTSFPHERTGIRGCPGRSSSIVRGRSADRAT